MSNRPRWPAVGWVAISVAEKSDGRCLSVGRRPGAHVASKLLFKCSSKPSCCGPASRSHLQGVNGVGGTASGASQKLTSTGRAAPREAVSVYPHTKTSMRILGLDLYARIRLYADTAVLRIPQYVHTREKAVSALVSMDTAVSMRLPGAYYDHPTAPYGILRQYEHPTASYGTLRQYEHPTAPHGTSRHLMARTYVPIIS